MAPVFRGPSPTFARFSSSIMQATKSSEVTKKHEETTSMMRNNSNEWAGNLMLMVELRKKILTFRDIIDLPPCDDSGSIEKLIIVTVEDLHNLYPNAVLHIPNKEMSMDQGLYLLHSALKSVGDFWAKNHKWIAEFGQNEGSLENLSLNQLIVRVLVKIDYMTEAARKMFDVMDVDEKDEGSIFGEVVRESSTGSKTKCPSPVSPTSLPPEIKQLDELAEVSSYSKSVLMPLRFQAVDKCLSFHVLSHVSTSPKSRSPTKENNKTVQQPTSPPVSNSNQVAEERKPVAAALPSPPMTTVPQTRASPPPPANLPSNVIAPSSPPPAPMALSKGGAPPPPPPLGTSKALKPKKANTKLKRSTQKGNLYRRLKGKVEGSNLTDKRSLGRKAQVGGSGEGKQGMADALAEITKRSAYFQQIEEDIRKHSKAIMRLKSEINSFKTKDMSELLKFHKHVEQHLEELTDETQVLKRFEDFPTTKLESLRTAAALYLRLEGIINNLVNWKIELTLGQLLQKVESYFNKIKGDLDALERTKDEDSKRFQSHNIQFDFNILVRIKECMVDVSSGCMELALKEHRRAKAARNTEPGRTVEGKRKACTIMLWRAFQLAFRVYSFAGGQDDRAENLTNELAEEIETDPQPE